MPPVSCPACGSADVLPIVYGLPEDELLERAERGEVALGGCCVEVGGPDTRCTLCRTDFRRGPPLQQGWSPAQPSYAGQPHSPDDTALRPAMA